MRFVSAEATALFVPVIEIGLVVCVSRTDEVVGDLSESPAPGAALPSRRTDGLADTVRPMVALDLWSNSIEPD
ncbi:hypothetical protein [Salinisphaera sp. T31B1]|uniref:hypothetical protein n=1 Tax=Salinisphaera sp. T31B1 TaxID=727963 RepID=UPI003342288C